MADKHAHEGHAHGELAAQAEHADPHAGHDHGHGHGHGHAHAPKDFGKAFLIGVILNGGFVAAEVVYGILGNSHALLADAGHNLSDVLGLRLDDARGHLLGVAAGPALGGAGESR